MSVRVAQKVEIEAVEMRKVFAETMIEMAREDPRVVYLECDLMNSIGMVPFSKEFPERKINCGIQEANMIGVASGLSAAGMIPFTHTFGVFASRRAADQVFLSAAYGKMNVRIIGSDPGLTAAGNGGTHQPFEDLGIMRGIPEITVIEPTDSVMLRDMLLQTKDRYGVFYIRLSRKKSERIYEEGSTFEIGRAVEVRPGNDVTLISSGICVADSLRAAELLAAQGVSARVVNVFTLKPIDKESIVAAARETGAIVTVENHNILNGLGSATAETLAEHYPVPMERIGVPDVFGEVGTMDYLKERYAMRPEDISAAARRVIARKT